MSSIFNKLKAALSPTAMAPTKEEDKKVEKGKDEAKKEEPEKAPPANEKKSPVKAKADAKQAVKKEKEEPKDVEMKEEESKDEKKEDAKEEKKEKDAKEDKKEKKGVKEEKKEKDDKADEKEKSEGGKKKRSPENDAEAPSRVGKRARKSAAVYKPDDFSEKKTHEDQLIDGRGKKLRDLPSVKESIESYSINSEAFGAGYRFLFFSRGKLPMKAKQILLEFNGYLPKEEKGEDAEKRAQEDEDLEVSIDFFHRCWMHLGSL